MHIFIPPPINVHSFNLGREGSQKSHVLSNLDFILFSYRMAIFNLNYTLINNLNTFNYLSKNR